MTTFYDDFVDKFLNFRTIYDENMLMVMNAQWNEFANILQVNLPINWDYFYTDIRNQLAIASNRGFSTFVHNLPYENIVTQPDFLSAYPSIMSEGMTDKDQINAVLYSVRRLFGFKPNERSFQI